MRSPFLFNREKFQNHCQPDDLHQTLLVLLVVVKSAVVLPVLTVIFLPLFGTFSSIIERNLLPANDCNLSPANLVTFRPAVFPIFCPAD